VFYNKMPYSFVSVNLTDGQVKKLRSKSAKECGTAITLKPSQMTGGTHKLSLTDRQIKHFNDALKKRRGVQIDFSKAAIGNMIKSGGIFPLLAAIPALIAAAAPAVAKAAALGAVGTAAGMALKKATGGSARGSGYKKKGKGLRLGRPGTYGLGLRLGRPI
jgi:hypothetical protein